MSFGDERGTIGAGTRRGGRFRKETELLFGGERYELWVRRKSRIGNEIQALENVETASPPGDNYEALGQILVTNQRLIMYIADFQIRDILDRCHYTVFLSRWRSWCLRHAPPAISISLTFQILLQVSWMTFRCRIVLSSPSLSFFCSVFLALERPFRPLLCYLSQHRCQLSPHLLLPRKGFKSPLHIFANPNASSTAL